ncbi:MAG TPA: twin-arginine translocation signal domain-containing protein, partial [Gemmatimonadetes bacterium]|nr:twin-arginine translocation signal domain-containing protein [Gemmatimonadota bacterium]
MNDSQRTRIRYQITRSMGHGMTKNPRKKSHPSDGSEQTASKITRRDLLKAAGAAGA